MNKKIELLRKARARLFKTGWIKGDAGPPEGPNCLWGAVFYSSEDKESDLAFRDVVNDIVILTEACVATFNDAPERTFDEVIDLIDLMIKLEENKETQ